MKKNDRTQKTAKTETIYLDGQCYHMYRRATINRMKKAITILQDLQAMPDKEVGRKMMLEMQEAAELAYKILRNL